jgi:methyl-accepting chemotaxis protein
MPLLNLRIRGRLLAGFGVLILSGVGLAGFGVYQLGEIKSQVGSMTVQSTNALRAGDIAIELEAVRRSILRYNSDRDEPSMKEAESRLAALGEQLQTALKATRAEERKDAYRQLIAAVDELSRERARLVEVTVKSGDAGTAAVAGNAKMAAQLEKLMAAAAGTDVATEAANLDSALLRMRIVVWRIQANREPALMKDLEAAAGKVREQIARLEKAGPPPEVQALLGPFKPVFEEYAKLITVNCSGLLDRNEVYFKSIVPKVIAAIEKIGAIKGSINKAFQATVTSTGSVIDSTSWLQEIVAGITTIFGLVIAFLIARGIIRPLSGLTAGMKKLAEGDFSVVLPGIDRKDEVGEMARAVEGFKVQAESKARADAEAKVQQDLAAAERRKREMHQLANDFESAVGQIIETVSSASHELESSAGILTSTAERAQELTSVVASASEEASTNVQSVASATEELTSSVNEISRQVQESAGIAQQAVDQAHRTNERVAELAKAASRIGDVLDLISTIAGQTNLLALNATIEAARAGEAGRGFAVVATEVKALADQTAKATGEISAQIAGMQTATQESVNAIREIGATIGRMSEIASTIASAVEEQGAATQEISRNVQQAAHGTMQVSSNITDVQRGATDTGSASTQVLAAAQSLSSESTRLKQEVGRFLDTVRAA